MFLNDCKKAELDLERALPCMCYVIERTQNHLIPGWIGSDLSGKNEKSLIVDYLDKSIDILVVLSTELKYC